MSQLQPPPRSRSCSIHSIARRLILLGSCFGLCLPLAIGQKSHTTWSDYGGGPDNSKYVSFNQITKANVAKLAVAWSYPTRDSNSYAFNPVVVGNTMYVLARGSSLVALNATTGKEIWVQEDLPGISFRGINYWESKDHKDRRLIFQINHYLEELDATTGKSILTFGNNGLVDLRDGLGRDPSSVARIKTDTPGKVFENLIMLGSATGENYMSPPGDLRAYNVITGKLAWIFHTVPHPGEPGYETWPKDAWKYAGGTNTWGELTLDEKNGIAYFPTGSPTFDLYGADRIGKDLYADCLLAINARTGKLVWYFQDVHHDLWDYDLTSAPQLITIRHNGKLIDAVAQAGKDGFLYVFDRRTGQPIWPIDEKPVPKSDVPGEQTWPTQPFPTEPPPFGRQKFTTADLDPLLMTDAERATWKARLAKADNKGLFTPPSIHNETVEMPGAFGGANFGDTSSNPPKGLVYVLSDDFPAIVPAIRSTPFGGTGGGGMSGPALYRNNCQSCHGANRVGAGEVPPLTGITSRLNKDDFKRFVATGRGDMPAFPQFGSAQLDQLFAYFEKFDQNSGSLYAPMGPTKELGGPVVGSGGAPGGLIVDYARAEQAAKFPGNFAGPPYPAGVQAPTRMYSDYGLDFPYIIKAPWSSLTAYDLNKGTIQWQIPVGEDAVAAAEGGRDTGVIRGANHRSIVVTSTGLLFVNCADGILRAYDAATGKVLWAYKLPAGTQGIPAMYEEKGREYLVVGATTGTTTGRGGSFGQVVNDDIAKRAYIAFALPE